MGCSIEDVKGRAAIGIMSCPIVAAGLPVPESDVPEMEGDSV